MSQLDDHITLAEASLKTGTYFQKSVHDQHVDNVLHHLLAAVKELNRRSGVTRFPVGE